MACSTRARASRRGSNPRRTQACFQGPTCMQASSAQRERCRVDGSRSRDMMMVESIQSRQGATQVRGAGPQQPPVHPPFRKR